MDLAKLFFTQRFHEIISHFEQISNFSPENNSNDSYILAASYFKIGEFQKAYNVLEVVESALYDTPDFLSLMGATCRRLTLTEKAKTYLIKAIELAPNSIHFKNNYSNLLIDLGEVAEAIRILEPIVASNPEYTDAQENLNRARFALESQVSSLNTSVPVTTSLSTLNAIDFWDPLSLAFSDDEVEEFGRIKSKVKKFQSSVSVDKSENSDLPHIDPEKLVPEYLQLAKKSVSDQNFSGALEFCTKIHQLSTPLASTYATASDAYIALKMFHEAEICLLTSIVVSEPTSVQFVNLASLASIRHDYQLAYLYLDKAASLDPSNPMLSKVRNNLNRLSASKPHFLFSEPWSLSVK